MRVAHICNISKFWRNDIYLDIYPGYVWDLPDLCLRYSWDMLMICLIFALGMPEIGRDLTEVCLNNSGDLPEIDIRFA